MIDQLYRALLRLLPPEYDGVDQEEIWGTYRARVERAASSGGARAATRERVREFLDLAITLERAWWPLPTLDSIGQDMRVGLRSLLRAPMATALAVGSLALGLGATTALFSVLDVWLVRPLPIPNAERVVAVGMANRERGYSFNTFTVRDFADWSRETESVELGIYSDASFNLALDGHVERVQALSVSANLINLFGIEVVQGRGFVPEDARPDAPRVAVVTEQFWASAFGGDPAAVGRVLTLDGVPHTVVGVLHRDQGLPNEQAVIWRPLRISGTEPRQGHSFWGVALLGESAGIETARQELETIAARVAQQDAERAFPNAAVRPLRDHIYGPQFEQGGTVMALAVLFVLLIACANIANILLARGLARTQEMAVRGALGAGRVRLAQQLLVESLGIAVVGGVLGVGIAHVGLDLLLTYALPPDVPGWASISINTRMLALTAVLTVASALVFGLIPAVRTTKVDLRGQLADGGRSPKSGRHGRLGSALVVGEISASLVLLVLSGLMIKAVAEARSVDLGMKLDNGVVFRIDVAEASRATAEDVRLFYDAMAERLRAEPGVTGVAHTSGHFLTSWSTVPYTVRALADWDDRSRASAEYRQVSYSYRDVLGLELIAGRWFDPGLDRPDGPGVAVVSRELTERWWSNPADALGVSISPRIDTELRIVGVVEGSRLRGPQGAPPPTIFEPFAQRTSRYGFWIVRHERDAQQVIDQVRSLVGEMDPDLAVFDVRTGQEMIEEALGPQHAGVRILGSLGGLALILTLVGVYGVTAHSVGRRTHEIGLRMALGATRAGLVRMTLAGSAKAAGIGLATGLLISMGAGQGLAFMLAGVSPRDPHVLTVVPILLLLAVVAASAVPAVRAARVRPVMTLRGE